MSKNQNKQNPDSRDKMDELPGYPVYPSNQDIFEKDQKVSFDESEITGERKIKSDPGLDEGLDVPGAELDDANELIGEEDEETHLIASAWNAVARLELYLRNKVK